MIRYKLLYAVLLVVMVLFYILYRGTLSLTLLVFTCILPLILLYTVVRLKASIKASLTHRGVPQKNQPFHWIFQIKNTSWISTANAKLHLVYSSTLADASQPLVLNIPIMMHNTQRIRLTYRAVTCGVMRMRIEKLEIYDPLWLFKRVIPLDLTDSVLLMPQQNFSFSENWKANPQADADTTEYSKEKAGDDPSEIFDLHVYREGDQVSRIHWKLSSKLDNLMVKEYSLPLSAGYLLFADFRQTADQPEAAERIDAMLSAMASAAAQLSEHMISFRAAAYTPDRGAEVSPLLQESADFSGWVELLVHAKPAPRDSKTAFLHSLSALLTESHPRDRVLLFTPKPDRELMHTLMALPSPARITLYAVSVNAADRAIATGAEYPFTCVPVTLETSVSPEPAEEADFEAAEREDFSDSAETDQEGGASA